MKKRNEFFCKSPDLQKQQIQDTLKNKIDKKFEMKIEKNNFVLGLKASQRPAFSSDVGWSLRRTLRATCGRRPNM